MTVVNQSSLNYVQWFLTVNIVVKNTNRQTSVENLVYLKQIIAYPVFISFL